MVKLSALKIKKVEPGDDGERPETASVTRIIVTRGGQQVPITVPSRETR